MNVVTTKRTKPVKDFACMECDKRFTFKQAERAYFGSGCPGCGGADIDLAPASSPTAFLQFKD